MIRICFTWLFAACFLIAKTPATAQNTLGKAADTERIALSPFVANEEVPDIPASALSVLLTRLRTLSTSNGFGGATQTPQFVLVAKPILIDKKVIGSAPTIFKVEVEVSLFMADANTRTIFATENIPLSGIGNSDAEAYASAFQELKSGKKNVAGFMKTGREGIIVFYNTRCDFILQRADLLVSTGQPAAALDLLVNIPEVCRDCFDKAVQKAPAVYRSTVDFQCQSLIQKARTLWAAAPNREGAELASAMLLLIPTDAKCSGEANQFLQQIEAKMLETEKWERKQYGDQIELMKLYIQAVRDVGVAYGNGQPDTVVHFKGWLW